MASWLEKLANTQKVTMFLYVISNLQHQEFNINMYHHLQLSRKANMVTQGLLTFGQASFHSFSMSEKIKKAPSGTVMVWISTPC